MTLTNEIGLGAAATAHEAIESDPATGDRTMPSLPPITPEQLTFVEHAQDLTFELAAAHADDMHEFVRFLDLTSLLRRIRAGLEYPEFAPPMDKAVETLRSATDVIEQNYEQSDAVEVLRVIADRWAARDEGHDDQLGGDHLRADDEAERTFTTVDTIEPVAIDLGNWITVWSENGRIRVDMGAAIAELDVPNAHQLVDGLQVAIRESVA